MAGSMSQAWKQLDLEGGGLQSANLRLATLLRQRRTAFALLALFPLGLHRDYLRDRRGAWLYRGASLLGAGTYLAGQPLISLTLLAALAACATFEAFRIDDAVAQINKKLRMQVYLSQAPGTPRGFKGHYTDDDPAGLPLSAQQEEPASAGQAPTMRPREARITSFMEQEKLLRDLAEIRGKTRK
jgi:hypothetical protein